MEFSPGSMFYLVSFCHWKKMYL